MTMIGKRLGHFQILEQIGSGGMGTVYRARDEHLDRHVALKVLPPSSVSGETARRRFRQEALALSKLNHLNIATIYDFDTDQGIDFLVTEYVPGGPLAERIRGGALPESQVIAFGLQIAEALEEAHQQGIIHRDLKPANIVLTPKGTIKVLDFGLAKFVKTPEEGSTWANLTEAGQTVGTLPYMAPEQLRGEQVSERSDLYSLGAVLYEMATGRRAFPGTDFHRLIESILNHPPPKPRELNPRLSRSLEGVILRLLEKSPAKRYRSAHDLVAAFQMFQEGSDPIPPSTPSRSRSAVWPAIAGVILAAAILVGWDPGGWFKGDTQTASDAIRSVAVLPLKNLTGDSEQEYLADGMTDQLIVDLGRIGDLRVISLTSCMRYKNTNKLLPEIARELNVDAIVEGSLTLSEDLIRVNLRLVDATTERSLITEHYEGVLGNVLALQRKLAGLVADKVQIRLRPGEGERLDAPDPASTEAYRLYFHGRYFWNKRTPDGLRKGLDYFQRAVETDPDLAIGHAGIADCYNLFERYGVLPAEEAFPKAKAAAERALEIDDLLGEAHCSLAFARLLHDWDWTGAKGEFERAIELSPNYATGHHWYSVLLRATGEFTAAIAEAERAWTLDPLSSIIVVNLGDTHFYAGNAAQAIAQYERALELDPGFRPALWGLAHTYSRAGLKADALEIAATLESLGNDDPRSLLALTCIYAASGRKTRAEEILRRVIVLSQERYVSPARIGVSWGHLGDPDEAMRWLKMACRKRDAELVYSKVDPRLDSLRDDPRFVEVLRCVGLD